MLRVLRNVVREVVNDAHRGKEPIDEVPEGVHRAVTSAGGGAANVILKIEAQSHLAGGRHEACAMRKLDGG